MKLSSVCLQAGSFLNPHRGMVTYYLLREGCRQGPLISMWAIYFYSSAEEPKDER